MLEVAIASVEGVLDWRAYQEDLRQDKTEKAQEKAEKKHRASEKHASSEKNAEEAAEEDE